MALLRQYFNGIRVNSLSVQGSSDDLDALKSLMDGKVEEWETKATGGSAAALPEILNTQKWVSRKGSLSCSFKIHHIDPNKNILDVQKAIKTKFDVGFYEGAVKNDEAYVTYNNTKK